MEAASASQKASFEQYVYPPLWEPEGDAIPVNQPTEPSHWDLYDLNRHAAAPLPGDDWYGLQGAFAVRAAGPWLPRQTYHYVPVLWLAAAQPYAVAPAQPRPPATGLRTVGYKATLLIPQHLRLASATPKVRRGRAVTLKGSLAVPSAATPGAAVSWAPAGTLVMLQKKTGARWITTRVMKTGARGSWRASVRVRRVTQWRAWWRGRRRDRGRVLPHQAHGRHRALTSPLPTRRSVWSDFVHDGTWFVGRFVIEIRGFACVDGGSRGRRGRTQLSLTIYREWRLR